MIAELAAAGYQTGYVKDAIALLRLALSGSENDPDVLIRLGYFLRPAGDFEETEVLRYRAEKLAPLSPTVHYNLGILTRQRGDLGTWLSHRPPSNPRLRDKLNNDCGSMNSESPVAKPCTIQPLRIEIPSSE